MDKDREGIINPGDVPWFPASEFGGYLWGKESSVWISIIESKSPGTGSLSRLFDEIWRQGRTVKVPTPFRHMTQILQHKGFAETWEDTRQAGPCEVWVKDPPAMLLDEADRIERGDDA